MKIAKNTVVTVEYKLSDAQNNLIEDGRQPMVYLHGGYENTLPKLKKNWTARKTATPPRSRLNRKTPLAITTRTC